jgi:hypothetical protein
MIFSISQFYYLQDLSTDNGEGNKPSLFSSMASRSALMVDDLKAAIAVSSSALLLSMGGITDVHDNKPTDEQQLLLHLSEPHTHQFR